MKFITTIAGILIML